MGRPGAKSCISPYRGPHDAACGRPGRESGAKMAGVKMAGARRRT